MIALGIEPGTAITGYGLVSEENGEAVAVAYGAVTTPSDLPLPERLKLLQRDLAAVKEQHRPDQAAAEQPVFQTNVRTALAGGAGGA